MKLWNTFEKTIDFIAEMMGRLGWLLIIYLMVFGVTDVFLRYVLNSPSLWISSTLQVAMVLLACVGGIYSLNDNAFVKLDLFYAAFSHGAGAGGYPHDGEAVNRIAYAQHFRVDDGAGAA